MTISENFTARGWSTIKDLALALVGVFVIMIIGMILVAVNSGYNASCVCYGKMTEDRRCLGVVFNCAQGQQMRSFSEFMDKVPPTYSIQEGNTNDSSN